MLFLMENQLNIEHNTVATCLFYFEGNIIQPAKIMQSVHFVILDFCSFSYHDFKDFLYLIGVQ